MMRVKLTLLGIAAVLATQSLTRGCIGRPAPAPRLPTITVICIAPTVYRLYIKDYVTVAGTRSTFCACGLGLPKGQTVITGATGFQLIDAGTGLPISDATGELFPFKADQNVGRAFQAVLGLPTMGFLAAVPRPVPGFVSVTFCFTITVGANTTFARLAQVLRQARIGGDEAKSNGTLTGSHRTAVNVGVVSQGCIQYWKFNGNVGKVAINFAGGLASPPTGTMTHSGAGTGPWQSPGRFGASMLKGGSTKTQIEGNVCDTGWQGGLAGSCTIAFWCKTMGTKTASGVSYIFGGAGQSNSPFRMFTGGIAGATLHCQGWNQPSPPSPSIIMPTVGASFVVRAAAGVHIALVIDGVAGKYQWYVDGAVHGAAIAIPTPGALTIPVSVPPRSMKIGMNTGLTSASIYNIDEFKFCNFAATSANIKGWSRASWAVCARYGQGCGFWHGCLNGPPRTGNATYALTIAGPSNSLILLAAGVRRNPNPLDLGLIFANLQGCRLYPVLLFQVIVPLPTGSSIIPAPIPNDPSLAGLSLETQLLGVTGNRVGASNVVITSIEIN